MQRIPAGVRAAALVVLPQVLSVAELEAVGVPQLALAEALYADRPRTDVPRPAWHWGFVAFVRSGVLSWGREGSTFSPTRLIEQWLPWIANLPDAPRALHDLTPPARETLEVAFVGWRGILARRDGEDWEESVSRSAEWAARTWAKACDVRLAYDSELDRGVSRRRIKDLPRSRFDGVARLVGDRVAHREDEAALRRVEPAGDETFSVAELGRFEPGVMAAPDTVQWRVARSVAGMLEQLEREHGRGALVSVSPALRYRARSYATSLLAVMHFEMAARLDLDRAIEICATWMELASRGMLRWQAVLVGAVERACEEFDRLLLAGDLAALDAMLREAATTFRVHLPAEFAESGQRLEVLRGLRMTAGRPSRARVGPHGLVYKWCSAYGVDFPMYPSSQRPTRSARRVRRAPSRVG